MNGTFDDGFPKDPYQAVDFSYFLSDQEKQEWREWIPNANQASQQELVDTLHEIWKENQKNAIPQGFENQSAPNQGAPAQPTQPVGNQDYPPTPNAPAQAYPPQMPPAQTQPSTPPPAPYPQPPQPAGNQADPFDSFGAAPNQTQNTPPAPKPAPTPAPTQPKPNPPEPSNYNPADPFGPTSPFTPQPTVIPGSGAQPAASQPKQTPPNTPNQPKPANTPTSQDGQLNEFYFPQDGANKDSQTNTTPQKAQPQTDNPKTTPPPAKPKEEPKPADKKPEPKPQPPTDKQTPTRPTKPADKPDLQNEPKNQDTQPKAVRLEGVDRQLLKNQLSLLEKLNRNVGRLEKSFEDLKQNQTSQPTTQAKQVDGFNQTAQKIQKDTGSLSSMVNALYDEMSILRTMVQNQQAQIRTLNAHLQEFYTGEKGEAKKPQSQPSNPNPFSQNQEPQQTSPRQPENQSNQQPGGNPFNQQNIVSTPSNNAQGDNQPTSNGNPFRL
jgi:hypothetical protein